VVSGWSGAKLRNVEQPSRLLIWEREGSRDGRPTSQTALILEPFVSGCGVNAKQRFDGGEGFAQGGVAEVPLPYFD